MTEETKTKKSTNSVVDPNSDEIVKLIRKRANYAAGVGLLGFSFLNFAGVTAIQVEMVKSLCARYDRTFNEATVRNIISGLLSSGGATLAAPFVTDLALAIPLVGFPLAVATKPAINGITTYALGHVFAVHFAKGGSLVGVATDELSKSFSDSLRDARSKMASVIAGKQTADA